MWSQRLGTFVNKKIISNLMLYVEQGWTDNGILAQINQKTIIWQFIYRSNLVKSLILASFVRFYFSLLCSFSSFNPKGCSIFSFPAGMAGTTLVAIKDVFGSHNFLKAFL